MVKHYRRYCLDRDFGPFFLKFPSYFPYTAKLCLYGHEYAKRQLLQESIAYKALHNGLVAPAPTPAAANHPRRVTPLGRCRTVLHRARLASTVLPWPRSCPPVTNASSTPGWPPET